MNTVYRLIGFLNLFNIVPDFVLPVFEHDSKLYFQEGQNDRIAKFGEAKQSIRDKILPFNLFANSLSDVYLDTNSHPIYAFQENANKIVWGESGVLKRYFITYKPINDILESEIKDFLSDIMPEQERNNIYKNEKLYYYGTGRRKHSVARVRVYIGTGNIAINGRSIDDYFGIETLKLIVRQPLSLIGALDKFDVVCTVAGGGVTGQAGAIRHGLSRALLQYSDGFRPQFKKAGYLTRDPRMKERKKYGLKAARRSPQYSKR